MFHVKQPGFVLTFHFLSVSSAIYLSACLCLKYLHLHTDIKASYIPYMEQTKSMFHVKHAIIIMIQQIIYDTSVGILCISHYTRIVRRRMSDVACVSDENQGCHISLFHVKQCLFYSAFAEIFRNGRGYCFGVCFFLRITTKRWVISVPGMV